MLLVFMLTYYLDGQPQPEKSYWQSIDRCEYFAQKLRRQNFMPYSNKKFKQPISGATCSPVHVNPKTTVIYK